MSLTRPGLRRSKTTILSAGRSTISANRIPSRYNATVSRLRFRPIFKSVHSRGAGQRNAFASSMATKGRSGTSTTGRDDFAWLLSEIALGHVGLVLCFQINRLAREDEACCRLIRVCAAFDTLLADQDGLYHPHDFNDRMILTIKGFMGGFELHQLQQFMQTSRLNKCRRGEWIGQPPKGYVVGPDGKLRFDPDEQVQDTVRLVLEQFAVLGSISALMRYLRQHRIQLPFRPASGPEQGQLQWHTPHRETLRLLVRNPAYAGAYTWGRYATDPRRVQAGSAW